VSPETRPLHSVPNPPPDAAHRSQVVILPDQYDRDIVDTDGWDTDSSSADQNEDIEKKKKRRYKFKVPEPPSKTSPPGPAYSLQTLSLLGYTQYFANLSHINNDFHGEGPTNSEDLIAAGKWKGGHHHGKVKKGKPNPKPFKFEVEYDTFSDKIFGLKDLTVRSYINLAKKIATSKENEKTVAMEDEEDEEVGCHENDPHEEERSQNDSEVEVEGKKKKKHKKKKKKKGKKHHKNTNKVWFAFVKRAFVGTMDPSEIVNQYRPQRTSRKGPDALRPLEI